MPGRKFSIFSSLLLALVLFSSSAQSQEEKDPVKYLNKGQILYQSGSFDESYRNFTQSIETLKGLGTPYQQSLVESYLWAGAAAYRLDKIDTAEGHYLDALRLAEKLQLETHVANILTALANLYSASARYTQAATYYLKASDSFQKLDLPEQAQNSREYGGYMKSLAGDYSGAYAIFNESVNQTILNPGNDRQPNVVAWIYAMRGLCQYYLANLQNSFDDYAVAVDLMSQYEPTREYGQYLAWQGKAATDLGDYPTAQRLFDRALEVAQHVEDPEDQALAYAYKGFIYAMAKDYTNGALYYEKSLEMIKTMDNLPYLIDNLESLAWIYREAGNHKKCLENYQNLLPLYKNPDSKTTVSKLAENYNQIGLQEFYLKNYASAISSYQQSLKHYTELAKTADHTKSVTTILFNLGVALENAGQTKEAALYLEKSITYSLNQGNLNDASESLSVLTEIYQKEFGYEKLISLLKKLLPAYSGTGKEKQLADFYNFIGRLEYSTANYSGAVQWYQQALGIARQNNQPDQRSIFLHNIAQAKAGLSQFDEALEGYQTALQIARKNYLADYEAGILNSIGELYRAWGWYEKSLEYYHEAEVIYKTSKDNAGLVSIYNNNAQAIRQSGRPEKSIAFYETALDLNQKLNDPETQALLLSNLGEALRESAAMSEHPDENYQRALKLYFEAMKIDKQIHNTRGVNIRRNNIALIYQLQGDYKKAAQYFEDGLKYWRAIGSRRDEATAFNNLGHSYYFLKDYQKAAGYFEDSIAIHEKLRLTARGAVRREYLASQIFVYRNLALTYFEKGDLWKSLYALELSRAKYLLEQMSSHDEHEKKLPDRSMISDFQTFSTFQNRLKKTGAMLSVSNLGENVFQIILLTPQNIYSTVTRVDPKFMEDFYDRYANQVKRVVEDYKNRPFDALLVYYRYLLSKPIHSRRDNQAFQEISLSLYDLWISPMQKYMKNISELLIIPDGILGTIPFETLRGANPANHLPGPYLIEKYTITYAQSLTIAEINRDKKYNDKRNPLLALGGAIYNQQSKEKTQGSRGGNINGIRRDAEERINSGESTRALYSDLGYSSWANLPGTLEEVKEISQIIPGSEIQTGQSVSETAIKKMSLDGKLENYKVLHFATHGIVIPEVPELSAVVLSQLDPVAGNEDEGDDGYLTMKEVSHLKIKSDFVNLSACETGLGKIYEGEGVVGLTQAFMVAGARALSVSLWQVSDESTMKFMSGMYRLVSKNGLDYPEAMAKMKREFIKDERLKLPFFWAPFVYYGMMK